MKGKKQRIILKWWQKILLILASTALCVLGAWLLCEKILEPSYVDTMRAELVINEDGMQKMKETQGSEFIDDVLDIRGSLRDELGKVGSREEKGRYYKLLSEALLAEDGSAENIVRRLAAVGLAGSRCHLVAPLVGAVYLTAIGNIGSRHFCHTFQLVDNITALEQIEITVFA